MIRVGGPQSKLIFVGDYPTKSEIEVNRAFSASTEYCLNRALQPFNKKVTDFYSTYLVKTGIEGFGSRLKKKKEEAWQEIWESKNWGMILKDEIDMVKPNIIVCFGEKTFIHLTGESKVSAHRGSILNIRQELNHFEDPKFSVKVLPISEPREIMANNYKPIPYTQWDLQKAFQYAEERKRFEEDSLVWIAYKPHELDNWWKRARHGEYLTVDIETHLGFITCIGFCHDGQEAISVPLINSKNSFHELGAIYQHIYEILKSNVPKVNQNIKYDLTCLERFGFKVMNVMDDTMLLAHSIYPELPKGLDFLNSIYTNIPYYKDEGKDYDPKQHSFEQLLRYNAKDALSTWRVYHAQKEDAKALHVWDFHRNKVWPTFQVYKKSDERGLRIDNERRIKVKEKYQNLLHKTTLPLKLLANDRDFNIESPKQVGKFLYEYLEIKARRHQTPTGGMAYSTDRDTLEGIIIKGEDKLDDGRVKVIQNILFGRQISTILSFLDAPTSLDGKFRQFSKISGVETGRTSAGKACETRFVFDERKRIIISECGWSFQTIGKHPFRGPDGQTYGDDLRSIFVPSIGYVFVAGDQSQAEARVVAVLSKNSELLGLFDKIDIHKHTASNILGKPIDQITKEERQWVGKTGRHAGNYNESPGGLMLRTHKPIKECRMILNNFHSSEPLIRQNFHEGIRRLISNQRFLVSPSGRRRDFFGNVSEDMYKEAFATIPQATVSDHTKHTIIPKVNAKWDNADKAFLITEAHDGVLYEVKEEFAEEFSVDLKEAISIPIDFVLCSMSKEFVLTIPGEVDIYKDSWAGEKD